MKHKLTDKIDSIYKEDRNPYNRDILDLIREIADDLYKSDNYVRISPPLDISVRLKIEIKEELWNKLSQCYRDIIQDKTEELNNIIEEFKKFPERYYYK